jgi:hypothetical protein
MAVKEILTKPGTAVSFKSAGGDVTFTPTSVANGAGRISAQWDRGAGSKPALYLWRAKTKAAAALTAGNLLELYLAFGDGTNVDANMGTADAAWSTGDKRRNLKRIGAVEADSTTNGEPQHASGLVVITSRYVSVAWWNALGQALSGTAGDHEFTLTPHTPEIQ